MKTASSTKVAIPATKPAKPAPPPREGLPIKLESRQSIRALVTVAPVARTNLARRSSRPNLEGLRSETSKSNLMTPTANGQSLTHSYVQEDRRSNTNVSLTSERTKLIPVKPAPPKKVAGPATPVRPVGATSIDLRRKGSNSNLAKPALPLIDVFVTETFEERPKLSLEAAEGSSLYRRAANDVLKNTASTGTSGHAQLDFTKCDSVDLEGSKRASMTPFTDRSLLDTTNKRSNLGALVDTVSLLEDKAKSSAAELVCTLSRLSSAVKGSMEQRREVDRGRRRAVLRQLGSQLVALKARAFEQGLVQLRRVVGHNQRLRRRQVFRQMLRAFTG